MYVQEGYSLSCDALIKVIRSPRSNWKLMFQGKRPKTLFKETPRPLSIFTKNAAMSASSDSPHLERVLGL